MRNLKFILTQFALIATCILSGWLVLTVSYSLPQDKIQDNIYRSAKFFEKNYVYTTGDNSGRLDLWTDARMLLTAGARDNKRASVAALESLSFISHGGPAVFLHEYYGSKEYKGNSVESAKSSWARYWHGYLVFLRPLLSFTDYGNIIHLNTILHFLLVGTVFLFMFIQKRVYLAVALFLAWLMINPVSVCLCLQYTAVTNLTLLAIIGILVFEKALTKRPIVIASYFTVLGALVNFFDFLSFPLASLGIPLVFLIYLQYGVEIKNYKPVAEVVLLSACWFLGYSGMWFGKWILTDLLTNIDIVSQVITAITSRGGSVIQGHAINYLDLLGREFSSLSLFWRFFFVISWIFSAISLCFPTIRKLFSTEALVTYFFVSIYPFIWLFLLQNHSYVHSWFVFRILSVNLIVAVLIPVHIFLMKVKTEKTKSF